MEAITLTRKDYDDGIKKAGEAVNAAGESYVSQFSVTFPEGLNTASSLEICRAIQDSSFEAKLHITKLCIADKNVEVTCPNGDVQKFHISKAEDSLEGFKLFQEDPLALIAITDAVYGYILKKSLRLSQKPKAAAATN